MASLKELRGRIDSVKSTQRITSAMKMVAGAKLARAQEQAVAARPYADSMGRMLDAVAAGAPAGAGAPPLLSGTGENTTHLLIVVTSDRGLCGGFNGAIARWTRQKARSLTQDGKQVKLLIIGRKGLGLLGRDFGSMIVDTLEDVSKPSPTFDGARKIGLRIAEMLDNGEFDVCTIVYNKFQSALTQIVTPAQLIPFSVGGDADGSEGGGGGAAYDFEPDEAEILANLLPRNLAVQIYRALLESFASEQGARMTAMDSASRNAGDMIDRLTQTYNRSRQAEITKELIEIISGAEAL
jgi:F-type H+-transporting ATPase subunit gamma